MQEPSFSVSPFSTPEPRPTVTTATATNKFVLLGLSDGSLAMYDVFGNLVDHHRNAHSSRITALSLDAGLAHDEVLASAASNVIRVVRLCTSNSAHHSRMVSDATLCFNRAATSAVTAIALDPNFGKPRYGDRIAYADQQGHVIIFTSAWFAGGQHLVRHPSPSPVHSIAWYHHLLAYATDDGVRVYDTRAQRPVCHIHPPGASNPPSPLSKLPISQPHPPASPTPSNPVPSDPPSQDIPKTPPSSPRTFLAEVLKTTWTLQTKMYMEASSKAPISPHNEPSVLLYITWPSGARIVQIGPHQDVIPTENIPFRQVDVLFRVERHTLLSPPLASLDPTRPPPNLAALPDQSPILSIIPFGEGRHVVLLGTPDKRLVTLLVNEDAESEKSMVMPLSNVRDADLLPIPGGDPLALIVGHRIPDVKPTTTHQKDGNSASQNLFYLRPLTTGERVKWLLGQNRFSDALNVAQSAPGGSLRRAEVSMEDIGEQFLESLLEAKDYEHLAKVLPETIAATSPYTGFRAREKIMSKRKKRWERWIATFRKLDKLAIIAPSIPTYEPCLEESTYDGVLVELCARDPSIMLHVLKTWPADVFGVSTVTKAIEEQLGNEQLPSNGQDRESLREGLLMLYGLSGRHDETLNLLLREESEKVYDYIRSHHLFEAVRAPETISGLYKINTEAATEMLSHAPETVLPPEAVVPLLMKVDNPQWTFMYLHAVFKLDPDHAPKYHNHLLKLYVDHGSPGMLFNFLKTSSHYSLDRALQEMGGPKGVKSGHLARERVYVLSAMGDLNSAMDILLNELGDTFAAIEFASDHGDTALWERLIEHAGTHADTLAALLDSPAGGKVDPVRLIPLLNSEMKISNLRDRLHRILVDAALERALREDAAAALHYNASQLLEELDECVSSLPSKPSTHRTHL